MPRATHLAALLAASACGTAFAAGSPPAYTVHVSEYTNAVYSLDCRAGLRPCSRAGFAPPGAGPDDPDPSLDAWRRLSQSVSAAVETPDAPASAYPTPATLAGTTSAREDLTLAALSAPSRDALQRRVEYRLSARSAERYLDLVTAERDRHAAAWPDTAIRLAGMRTGFEVLRRRAGIDDDLRRLRSFFGAAEAPALQVHLVGLPAEAPGSVASQQRDHAFIESRRGDSPADRYTAVLHELSHYWFAAAPDSVHESILAAVIADDDPAALALYNLFDEIVATAVANGYIERRLVGDDRFADYAALPESFYGDPDIDAASKAALPLVEEYLLAGRTLDGEFATRLLAVTAHALAGHRFDLRLQLRTSALIADAPLLDAAVYSLRTTHGAAAVYSETLHGRHDERRCALHRYRDLSAIVMVDSGDLAAIAWLADGPTRKRLRQLANDYRRFVYGWQRTPRSTVYFVVGEGATERLRGFGQLLATRERFSGLGPGALTRAATHPASVPERYE